MKEAMKIMLTIVGVAVGMIQSAAFAAEEPGWSLEGRSITVDSCGVDCHCLIGGPPDNGASAEQREALRKLFSGSSPHAIGQPAEVNEIAIKFQNLGAFGQVGKTTSGTMGEIAKVEVPDLSLLSRRCATRRWTAVRGVGRQCSTSFIPMQSAAQRVAFSAMSAASRGRHAPACCRRAKQHALTL
jgi:hypothetical protein